MKDQVRKLWESGVGQRQIARETGVARSTVQSWIKEFKNVETYDVPLSEVAIPKLHEATPQETIDDLRRLAEEYPERSISRNFYRVHGTYSESAWNQYWGTFAEYRRQAGVVLTRQQHNIEKQIAKQASIDHYRAMNSEIRGYADKYLRPNIKRFKTAIIAGDFHDINIDPFFLRVYLDTIKRVSPDAVIINGDGVDLPHFGKYNVDVRDWDVVGRIKFLHTEVLEPIRNNAPDAEIFYHGGNHEHRLIKHLADATPALRVLLSDLHGMTVASLLGLDKYQINYIAKDDLAAYTLSDIHKQVAKNYRVYWDSFIVGHDTEVTKLGYPCVNGHHHKTVVAPMYNEHFGCYSAIQHGCGHKLDAEYCHAKWQLGFVIATCDTLTNQTVFDTVTFSENFVVVGGKFYER